MAVAVVVALVTLFATLSEASPLGVRVEPDVRLVQTVPLETDIGHAKLAHAKETWLEMIRGAQSSIDLGQFYVSSKAGEALDAVLDELEHAADRGVNIRLMVSNVFAKDDVPTLDRIRKMKNAQVRIYDISKLTGGIIHAKYWVIDQKEIFVGSQNFDWRSISQIHEMGVRIKDEKLAKQLESIFDLDWKFIETGKYPEKAATALHTAHSAETPTTGHPSIELVASPPQFNPQGTRWALDALLELVRNAKKSIRIQVLDYSPLAGKNEFWTELDNALRAAAVRGVKIEMLVSNWNTEVKPLPHLKSLSLIPNIEIRIVTLPLYHSTFIPFARVIHSKYMVIDDEVLWVGTSNFSKGYFYDCRNIELIFRNPALATQGNEVFSKIWSSAYADKVDPVKIYPKPRKGE